MSATLDELIAVMRDCRTLLEAMNDRLASIEARLGQVGDSRSSVQVATSTRGYDVTVKSYDHSPISEAGDAAVSEYVRVVAAVNHQLAAAINGEVKL